MGPQDITINKQTVRLFGLPNAPQSETLLLDKVVEVLASNAMAPQGKLWFHACTGSKAFVQVIPNTTLKVAATPGKEHDFGSRDCFYLHESLRPALQHKGGSTHGQAIAMKTRCILVFDDNKCSFESGSLIPSFKEWQGLSFASRNLKGKIHTKRPLQEAVDFFTQHCSRLINPAKLSGEAEDDLFTVVEDCASLTGYSWIFSWMIQNTHVDLGYAEPRYHFAN